MLAEQLSADKAALNARVAGLAAQVEQLTQTVATLSGLLFGASSEKKRVVLRHYLSWWAFRWLPDGFCWVHG